MKIECISKNNDTDNDIVIYVSAQITLAIFPKYFTSQIQHWNCIIFYMYCLKVVSIN